MRENNQENQQITLRDMLQPHVGRVLAGIGVNEEKQLFIVTTDEVGGDPVGFVVGIQDGEMIFHEASVFANDAEGAEQGQEGEVAGA